MNEKSVGTSEIRLFAGLCDNTNDLNLNWKQHQQHVISTWLFKVLDAVTKFHLNLHCKFFKILEKDIFGYVDVETLYLEKAECDGHSGRTIKYRFI